MHFIHCYSYSSFRCQPHDAALACLPQMGMTHGMTSRSTESNLFLCLTRFPNLFFLCGCNKKNQNLFEEMYVAYLNGRTDKDPAEFWYKVEFGFFDFYIVSTCIWLFLHGVVWLLSHLTNHTTPYAFLAKNPIRSLWRKSWKIVAYSESQVANFSIMPWKTELNGRHMGNKLWQKWLMIHVASMASRRQISNSSRLEQ